MLRRLREDSSKNDTSNAYSHYTTAEKQRKLEQSMEVDGGEELLKNLPHLVKMRRTQIEEDWNELEMRNASMRRIIAGYQNALGAGATTVQMGGGNAVLQQ